MPLEYMGIAKLGSGRKRAPPERHMPENPISELSKSQARYLRGIAHKLRPVMQLGAAGITPEFREELERALERHELVKLRVPISDRDSRNDAVRRLQGLTGAAIVQQVGKVATLYRPRAEDPSIRLPD